MVINKLYFLILPLVVLLILGCTSFENEPKPVGPTKETANIDIGNVIRSGEFEQRVETEQIPQNNCQGKSSFTFSVSRERTLEQSVDLTFQGQGGGEFELAGKPMEVGVAGKIIAAIGAEYGQSGSKSISDRGGMEFTIDSGDFPTYIIVWREKWEKGYIEIQYNGESLQIPYLYLTTARPELVNVEYKDCETGQSLPSAAQENGQVEEVTKQPTNTPAPPPTETFNCENLVTSSRSLQLMDTGNRCWFKLVDGDSTELIFNQAAQTTFAIGDGRGDRYFFIANPGDRLSDVYGATIRSIPFVNSQYGGIEQVREFETTYHNPGGDFPTCLRDWNNNNSPMTSLCQ